MSILPPLTPVQQRSAGLWQMKAAKREAEVRDQSAQTEVIDGYTVRPAIGRTGGVANVGWELIPPSGVGRPWFLATRLLAIQAIPRHKAMYA